MLMVVVNGKCYGGVGIMVVCGGGGKDEGQRYFFILGNNFFRGSGLDFAFF